jgi:hypothetical protein
MKISLLTGALILSALLFTAGTGIRLSGKMSQETPLSCISRHTLLHGGFSMTARYFFSFYEERGVVRINGTILRDRKIYPISRQIFFTYTHEEDEYTLKSTYIEKMSTDRGDASGAEKHLPSFFSAGNRKFNFTLHQDRYRNAIIIFTEVPVFYCARRDLPLRS